MSSLIRYVPPPAGQNRSLSHSGALIRPGPGAIIYKLSTSGARLFSTITDEFFKGPETPHSNIVKYFRYEEKRQKALCELYEALKNGQKRGGELRKLEDNCQSLLKYALAGSQTLQTQLVTFRMLVSVITRYPGIRRVLRGHKDSQQSLWLWKDHLDCGEEWAYWKNFAAFCIDESDLTQIMETAPPSELGCVELDDRWRKVPVENLLSLCCHTADDHEFQFDQIAAIRYLASILELPSFWMGSRKHEERFGTVFNKLCETLHQLITDTLPGASGNPQPDFCPLWMSASREAVDNLARAVFFGLGGAMNAKHLRPPSNLRVIIDMFQRPEVQRCFEKASKNVTAVWTLENNIATASTDQGNNPGLISIVEKIIKDSLIERFFWNKGDFITKFSQNAVNLISDTSTPLGCPELFPKIIKVSLHQQVVYCDDSSSMRRDGRWEAQKKLVRRITQITTRILPEGEGVALRFINQNVDQSLNLTFTQIGNIIEPMSWQPGGCTELGTSLKSKILEPMVYAKLNPPKLDRPLLISVITDGMPDPENPYIFADAILECGMRLEAAGYPRESVKFLIGQIGTARIGFLDSLRDNKAIEQVIYATSDQLDEKFATLHQNEGELDRWLIETLLSPIKDW